jgi:hypothetical protein
MKFTTNLIVLLVFALVVGCSSEQDKVKASTGDATQTVSIEQRIQNAADKFEKIKSMGYAWTTMQPLLDKANDAHVKSDDKLASELLDALDLQLTQAQKQAEVGNGDWQQFIVK